MNPLHTNLNSGFELDPLETDGVVDAELVEQIEVVTIPILKENIEIVQLTHRLDDLNYLEQDIKQARGMKRIFAEEAQVLIPDFISDKRPLEFFTEFPTKTQFQATLECIEKEQKNILSKIEVISPSFEKMMDPFERDKGSIKQHFFKLFDAVPVDWSEITFKKKDVNMQVVEEMQKHPDLLRTASKWMGSPHKTTVDEMEKLHQIFSGIQKPSRHPKLYRGFKLKTIFSKDQQTLDLDFVFKNKSEFKVGEKFSFVCKKPVSFTYQICNAAVYGDIIISIKPDNYYSQLFEISKELIYAASDLFRWKWIKNRVTEYYTECEFVLMPSDQSIEFTIESVNGKTLIDKTTA